MQAKDAQIYRWRLEPKGNLITRIWSLWCNWIDSYRQMQIRAYRRFILLCRSNVHVQKACPREFFLRRFKKAVEIRNSWWMCHSAIITYAGFLKIVRGYSLISTKPAWIEIVHNSRCIAFQTGKHAHNKNILIALTDFCFLISVQVSIDGPEISAQIPSIYFRKNCWCSSGCR